MLGSWNLGCLVFIHSLGECVSFCQVCFNFLIMLMMCGILKIIFIIPFSSACSKFEFQLGVYGNVFLLKELGFTI